MSEDNITRNRVAQQPRQHATQLLSLHDLINIVRHRWILASSIGFVVASIFAIYFLNQTPEYEAESSIVVELNAENVVNVQEVVESGVQNSSLLASAMNTHIERLKSRMMAQSVADSLTDRERERLITAFIGPLDELEEGRVVPEASGSSCGGDASRPPLG